MRLNESSTMLHIFTYFDKTIMKEEADGGGARSRRVAVASSGDGGHDLVELGAGLGIEIEGEVVVHRRSPPGGVGIGDKPMQCGNKRRDEKEKEAEEGEMRRGLHWSKRAEEDKCREGGW